MIAGYLGNYFSLQLFFGVEFLFGSIAVLLVVHLFGTWWGTIAAIIASMYTILFWNHPYAAILFVGEALFVGMLLQRRNQNMLLLDAIYWGAIGIPLGWFFYPNLLELDTAQTWVIVFKQSANGICNALVANLLLTLLPIHKWRHRYRVYNRLSVQQILLNLLVAFVIFPAIILMIFDSHRVMSDIETKIQLELQSTSTILKAELHAWHKQYLRTLSELGEISVKSDVAASDLLQSYTELMLKTFPDFSNLYIADVTGRIISSYPKRNTPENPNLNDGMDNQALLKVTQMTLQPAISSVHFDQILSIPHIDAVVPIVVENRLRGFAYGSLNLDYIHQLIKSHVSYKQSQITLVDQRGLIIASTQPNRVVMQPYNPIKGGRIRSIKGNLYQWLPHQGKEPPILLWQKSLYVEEIPITGTIPSTLVVELSTAPYASALYSLYLNDCVIMLLISVLAILLAVALSRRLTTPLSRLADMTTDLPIKLLQKEVIRWPKTPVREIDSLVRNFQLMAGILNKKFQEIQSVNESLEQRVQERTADLLRLNEQLASEIAERKQLLIQLSRREQVLSDYFENGSLGLHWVGADGTILWANRAELELLGYSREEYIGQHIANFHADQAAIDDILCRLSANETLQNYEARLRCKDGSFRYVLINSNVFWEEGEFIHTRCFTRDITQRKQAEEALRISEVKNRALLDAIPDLMFSVNKLGIIQDFKASNLSELYVPPSEFLGKNLQEVLPASVTHQLMPSLEQAFSTGQLQITEYQLSINGTKRDYEARIVICGDSEVVSIVRDITERKATEAALRESEEKFRQLAENIHEVFWISDANVTQIIYISPAYEQVWGRSCESLYANPRSWLESIHPQDKERVIDLLTQQSQGGYNVEYRLIRPDGSIRWIWDRGFPIRDEAGQVYRCAGIAEDITERKQAEAALHKSEEWFRNLVETTSDWVWEVNENAVYTYASPKLRDILGYEPEEVLGKTPFDLMPAEEAARIAEIFTSMTAKKQPFSCLENINVHKQGNLVVLETSGIPIFDAEGQFRGYRGIDRDITERQQAEVEIRHALEKEKQLNDLKSRFITTISHEFRTPLTTIVSSAELLKNYSHKATEEQKTRYFARIQAATRRMTHLLDDVLTAGRAEAGKLEFHPAPLNLEKFCRDLVEEIQLSAGSKHPITFVYQAASSAPTQDVILACFDEKLVRYILTNLISNAIKYSPEGGNIYFDLSCESGAAIFRIQDQGIGIPIADQPQVFDSFYRGSNVSNIPGTGLGLSIVKQCIDLHNGQIAVNSEVGVGTTFIVTLPLDNTHD